MKAIRLIQILEGIVDNEGDIEINIESSYNEYDSRPIKDVYLTSEGVDLSAG